MPFNVSFSKTAGVPGAAQKDLMFSLTNLGRQQVQSLGGDEPEFAILSSLAARHAMNMEDLSKETHLSADKIKFELKRLMKQGMVKTIGSTGE